MQLALYQDKPDSSVAGQRFAEEGVLEALKQLDRQARTEGLRSLSADEPLVQLGMEVNGGRVAKNSYGMFHLSWLSAEHPEWPDKLMAEAAEIRKAVKDAHGTPLRFVVWAGMGGSAEDKAMYQAVGLLRKGPRLYVLDSTDPAKLKAILDDMGHRSGLPLAGLLRSTLVVGQALGMTSYEPVVNLQRLAQLYDHEGVDGRANFAYLTLPDSLLDRFGRERGYRKIELQMDGGNSTSGRHSSPLTRGSLLPLALAGQDLRVWFAQTRLTEREVHVAFRLAAYLHAQAREGRNKLTLLLPKAWAGAGIWTKQDFEESLGKSEEFGLKVVVGEKIKLANYRPPKEPGQDRVFVAVQVKGQPNGDAQKASLLRRAGYPLAQLTLNGPDLARYLQFIHYTVFGVAYLQGMNFVTQPGVELYKAITNRLHQEACREGGIERSGAWRQLLESPRRVPWRGGVTLHYDRLRMPGVEALEREKNAARLYAQVLRSLAASGQMEYGELTFFGDTRYDDRGRAVRKAMERAGDGLFRSLLKKPVDVYEGPAMNHSYHEMVIGHGRCLSTVLLSLQPERIEAAGHTADYHRAQFLATQMALEERGRAVVAVTLRDLGDGTLAALEEFFRQAAVCLKSKG